MQDIKSGVTIELDRIDTLQTMPQIHFQLTAAIDTKAIPLARGMMVHAKPLPLLCRLVCGASGSQSGRAAWLATACPIILLVGGVASVSDSWTGRAGAGCNPFLWSHSRAALSSYVDECGPAAAIADPVEDAELMLAKRV